MKKKFLLLYSWLIRTLLIWLPDQPLIMKVRGFLYGLGMNNAGNNFQVSAYAQMYGLESISVGNNVFIATNVVLNAAEMITIESEVLIGIGTVIVSGNHTLDQKSGSYRFGVPSRQPIFIGFGSWLASNVTLSSGASIPKGTLIAANSFVGKPLTVKGIYGGVPVKLIK